jgi:plastocyanin
MRRRSPLARLPGPAAVLVLIGTLVLASAGIATAASVNMADNEFQPASITVAAGEAITFTNVGSNPHTATSDDGVFDTGTVEADGTASITLDSAGTFPYYCVFHGAAGGVGMSGTITVTGGGDGDGDGDGDDEPPPLPDTARPLPLIGAAGLILLATGLWLGRRRLAR